MPSRSRSKSRKAKLSFVVKSKRSLRKRTKKLKSKKSRMKGGKKSKRKRGGSQSSAIKKSPDFHRNKLIECLELGNLPDNKFYSAENLLDSITIKFNKKDNKVEFYTRNSRKPLREYNVNDKTSCASDIAKAIKYFNKPKVILSYPSSPPPSYTSRPHPPTPPHPCL